MVDLGTECVSVVPDGGVEILNRYGDVVDLRKQHGPQSTLA